MVLKVRQEVMSGAGGRGAGVGAGRVQEPGSGGRLFLGREAVEAVLTL